MPTTLLADYMVPVNADVPSVEIIMVAETDTRVNPLGVGIGEIGIVGVSAAVANAVFHATGKRLRELPIRVEQLLYRSVMDDDRISSAALPIKARGEGNPSSPTPSRAK